MDDGVVQHRVADEADVELDDEIRWVSATAAVVDVVDAGDETGETEVGVEEREDQHACLNCHQYWH